jgi:putative endonuclease
MAETNKQVGNRGEQIALKFLKKNKFTILAQNYRCKFGEIDIIARNRNNIISFIEVKTRTSLTYGTPQEAVTPRKQAQICKVAMEFVQRYKLENCHCRFDVMAINAAPDTYTVDFIANAFELARLD